MRVNGPSGLLKTVFIRRVPVLAIKTCTSQSGTVVFNQPVQICARENGEKHRSPLQDSKNGLGNQPSRTVSFPKTSLKENKTWVVDFITRSRCHRLAWHHDCKTNPDSCCEILHLSCFIDVPARWWRLPEQNRPMIYIYCTYSKPHHRSRS